MATKKSASLKTAAKKAKPAVKGAKKKSAPKPAKQSAQSDSSGMQLFQTTGRELRGEESQMFGKPCFKVNGKAFMSFFQECLVFKLEGKVHESAMKLKGAVLFDPSGKGRAMKEWVQVPMAHKAKFGELAKEAMKYVKSSTK